MKSNDTFRDSFLIFFDYINRKLKEDPNYEFHPLIKAFINALVTKEKVKAGQNVMGVSGETKEDKLYNPYVVVIEKKDQGFEIKEIRELTTNQKVPLDVIILTFRLQIHLDRVKGDDISPAQMAEILNEVLPEYHFYCLGDKWREARDKFAELLKKGKLQIPASLMSDRLIEKFKKIRYDTPWEEYDPEVRSMISGVSAQLLDLRGNTIIISTPLHFKVPKYKVFEFASQLLIGVGAKYLGGQNCIFCKRKNVEDYVISVEENFVILADKYPLQYGHMLVVSKKHVRAIGDLLPVEISELEDIIGKITKFYNSNKEEFVMFEPGSTGQTIYHGHIHFLPGKFYIEQAIKARGIFVEEIKRLSEISEKYKKRGGYFFWSTDGKMFIASSNNQIITNSFFRSLIASQLLNSALIDWTKLSNDKKYLMQTRKKTRRLRENWNKFFKSEH